jgi:phosphoserine phosphatase
MSKQLKIAFDIDDTLWKVNRKYGRQEPDYDLIQVLRWFYNNGNKIYVWSGGGVDYAQQIVDKLGLTEMVEVIQKVKLGDKSNPNEIDIAFDDEETNLAKVDIIVKR